MFPTLRPTPARRRIRSILALTGATTLLTLSACATGEDGTISATVPPAEELVSPSTAAPAPEPDPDLSTTLHDAAGLELGTVTITEQGDTLELTVTADGMEPGFYGFHIHSVGRCEPDSPAPDDPESTGDFRSAGSHLGSDAAEHPDHPGDLPQLLVMDSGAAAMTFRTDRLTLADLNDEDGAALIIHSDPDNYANIPERYAAEGADEDSRATGDAGSRLACGVLGS